MSGQDGGNDALSQQRMLQSYMENIVQHQQQAPQPQPGMHPGVSAAFQHQQQQQRQQQQQQQFQQFQQYMQTSQPQQQQQLWNQQPQQQQQQGNRLFPLQTPGLPPNNGANDAGGGGGMSQMDFNAMLASLQQSGNPQPQIPPQQQQQMGQAMLGNNAQQQQQPQSQVQGYPAPLQAAFQQMQNQHQNQNQNQQAFQLPLQNAQQMQQHQNQQQQFQNAMPVPQNQQQQNPQLDQQNLAMLLQLRQKGIQLTPDQQALLSRAMPRRGGIGDVTPGAPFQQQQQQQGQGQGQMVSPAMGNRQPGGAVPGQMPILPQQHQQQNMLAMQQQQAPPVQLQQQGQPGQKMQFPNAQGAPPTGSIAAPSVTVPIPALQEYTSLSEQLRQHMALENHLSVCLSQDLAVPLPPQLSSFGASLLDNEHKPVLPPPSAQQGNFARLSPDQKFSLEKHREHVRQLAGNAKGRLERLEAQYAGRDNILNSLRAVAAQRSTQPQRNGMVTPVNNAGNTGLQGQGQQNAPPQMQPQRAPNQQLQQQMQGVQQQQQQQPMNAYQNQLQKLVQAQQQGGQPQPQQEQQFNQQQLPQGQSAQMPPLLSHQQEFASPNMGPPLQPHPSPNLNNNANAASMPTQQIQASAAMQAQFLKNQQVAVNEEILKTLNAAGPKTFMKALFDTMKKRDRPIVNVPQVEGSDVDLHKLYKIVQQRGGSAPIRQQGLWKQVATEIGIVSDAESSQRVFQALEKIYSDYLEPFEEIQRKAALATVSRHIGPTAAGAQRTPQLVGGAPVPVAGNGQQQQFQQQQQYMQHLQAQAQMQAMQGAFANQQNPQQPPFSNPGISSPALPGNAQPTPLQHQGQFRPPGHARTASVQSQGVASGATPQMQQQQQQNEPQQQAMPAPPPPAQQQQRGLANMPTQEHLQRAKAEIEQMKISLQSNRPQYKVLDGIDSVEQAKFLALTKSLQPMVDKVLELLPLYLALSTQTEGARRLLVMMFMFRDQVIAFEQRKEYILRISDLEKLKTQLQRCWTFVSQTASGVLQSPLPGKAADLPSSSAVAANAVGAGLENTNFQGVVMRTGGLKMEDLKQPPGATGGSKPKRQGSGMFASDSLGTASTTAAGTGASYASPIQLDSPSPDKPAAQPALPAAAAGPKKKGGQTPDSTNSAPTPKSATSTTTTGKPKKGRAGAVNAKTPLGNEITYPEESAPVSSKGTPAPNGPTPLPSAAAAAKSQISAQTQAHIQAHQQVSLKRKRELEEAQNDPAAFSERLFAEFLSPNAVGAGKAQVAMALPTGSIAALSDGLGADWLSFLNEDVFGEPRPEKEKLDPPPISGLSSALGSYRAPLSSSPTSTNALSLKWYSETPNFSSAETPELDDRYKTSPEGGNDDSVFTPADNANNFHTPRTMTSPRSKNYTNLSKPIKSEIPNTSDTDFTMAAKAPTSAIMASFDREYERLFSDLPGTDPALPGSASLGNSVGLGWSWDTGLLPAIPGMPA